MAATRFRFLRRFLAPRWLTEGEGFLVGYSLDLMKDAFIERLRLGHLARYPQQDAAGTPAPADALAAIGRDRRVVQGINETGAAYAVRLRAWLDDRKRAGNPYALMQKLAEYVGGGSSFRIVDNSGNWYHRAADGTETRLLNQGNWNWDGEANKWSRFWVIIYPGTTWSTGPRTWGATPYGLTEPRWGCTATADQAATVRFLVDDWKPAGTRCVEIILAFDTASFDPTAPEPDGEWNHWYDYNGSDAEPARLATARYIGGT